MKSINDFKKNLELDFVDSGLLVNFKPIDKKK